MINWIRNFIKDIRHEQLLSETTDIKRLMYESNNYINEQLFKIDSRILNQDLSVKILIAQFFFHNINYHTISTCKQAEVKVFSQWGEDGIIQWIINTIPIKNNIFVEFGVENYSEANTKFLLINNNWSGLVIDSSQNNVESIRKSELYWKYDLNAICNIVTKENINDILINSQIEGDIGLLSIDIDGVDYWIWDAIEVISPRIVICEYNSIFGDNYEITVPYRADFDRNKAHYSNLYWGASLSAFCGLAHRKGYGFIGSNQAGNNAFFIRNDLTNNFNLLTAKEGYVNSKYRDSRDSEGNLSFVRGGERIKEINHLPVFDIPKNGIYLISQYNFG
jgi:hypothetical protein